MSESTSTLLMSQAAKLSEAILGAIKRKRLEPSHSEAFRLAGEAATRLHLISVYIGSLPSYWIDSEVEQLCHAVLNALSDIIQPTNTLTLQNTQTELETKLVTFFSGKSKDTLELNIVCDDLLSRLTHNDSGALELPDSALQVNPRATWEDVDNAVFETLRLIASCHPALHGTDGPALRHEVRLCLHEPDHRQSTSRDTTILVSAMDMKVWQEFLLRIHPEGYVGVEQQLLGPGGLCPILEEDCKARLILNFEHGFGLSLGGPVQSVNHVFHPGPGLSLKSVIRSYELTPKDKVFLSYAIAQAYYKYYNSELMQSKWTSDTIWFMLEDTNGPDGQLLLRAHIPLPSDLTNSTPLDITDEGNFVHRCPRIFDLAVLLLEIGLAKPFPTPQHPMRVSQANASHKIAMGELNNLEKISWSGLTHKTYFDSAIRFCLDDQNFIPPKQPRPTQEGKIVPEPTWWGKEGILARRNMLYKSVVRPLKYLMETGFKVKLSDIIYIGKKATTSLQDDPAQTALVAEPEVPPRSGPVPSKWHVSLQKRSKELETLRRDNPGTDPIRIAILDTGLDKNFPVFKRKSGLIKSVIDEKDFVTPGTPTTMDTFGHGTLMARLLMEIAPSVEILIARVATDTNMLQKSQDNIKDAILWAGEDGKADIISMSFGFPRDDQEICDAIETVRKARKGNIIFFASAGNVSTDDESFPARHPDVISVWATDSYGTFLRSNPASTANGAALLGTYGDPEFIRKEFDAIYPGICRTGSSVATVVMAGTAAIMLAYASLLPSLVRLQGKEMTDRDHVLECIRTTKGMEAVLHRLVQEDPDHPRLKAVQLPWFWKNNGSDMRRHSAILYALNSVDRRSPADDLG